MDNLREIYDQIKERPHGIHFEISTDAVVKSIIAEIREIRAQLFDEDQGAVEPSSLEKEQIVTDNFADSIKMPSFEGSRPEEVFISNARLIRDSNIPTGEILMPAEKYIYGYRDLTYEEFRSYVFWRTGVRSHNLSVSENTPRGFLYLHLYELVNFIEFDSVEETLFRMNYLLSVEQQDVHISMIENAMREFLLLYGSSKAAQECIESTRYIRLSRASALRKGKYDDALDYIADYFTKSIKNSAFYRDYSHLVYLAFPNALKATDDYFTKKGFLFVQMWVGKQSFQQMRHKYIKKVDAERVISKSVSYNRMPIYKVLDSGKVYEASLQSFGQAKDPGQCVFARSYIMQCFYSLFESEFRKLKGVRPIKVKTADLWQMSTHSPAVTIMAEAFDTEELQSCVRAAILQSLENNHICL